MKESSLKFDQSKRHEGSGYLFETFFDPPLVGGRRRSESQLISGIPSQKGRGKKGSTRDL